ncbi:unnamed protein product [Vitrella brassicaformis CCMP3155]|uniref:CBM20 domain-containing protein n=4 Tax=Vitrella brassicaformis TaxID=1169539 RepID=A0A0G4EF37_VITBC|nr:unnamed protein product [Vitrella brassicaformis CCMP3155]|eukprot:CEL94016.1 unnamed protein product [Vitrella brassicaformis CCMP3155]
MVLVKFYCNVNWTQHGQWPHVVGSSGALGEWNARGALPLFAEGTFPWFTGQVTVQRGTHEWKLIVKERDGGVVWEGGTNRLLEIETYCPFPSSAHDPLTPPPNVLSTTPTPNGIVFMQVHWGQPSPRILLHIPATNPMSASSPQQSIARAPSLPLPHTQAISRYDSGRRSPPSALAAPPVAVTETLPAPPKQQPQQHQQHQQHQQQAREQDTNSTIPEVPFQALTDPDSNTINSSTKPVVAMAVVATSGSSSSRQHAGSQAVVAKLDKGVQGQGGGACGGGDGGRKEEIDGVRLQLDRLADQMGTMTCLYESLLLETKQLSSRVDELTAAEAATLEAANTAVKREFPPAPFAMPPFPFYAHPYAAPYAPYLYTHPHPQPHLTNAPPQPIYEELRTLLTRQQQQQQQQPQPQQTEPHPYTANRAMEGQTLLAEEGQEEHGQHSEPARRMNLFRHHQESAAALETFHLTRAKQTSAVPSKVPAPFLIKQEDISPSLSPPAVPTETSPSCQLQGLSPPVVPTTTTNDTRKDTIHVNVSPPLPIPVPVGGAGAPGGGGGVKGKRGGPVLGTSGGVVKEAGLPRFGIGGDRDEGPVVGGGAERGKGEAKLEDGGGYVDVKDRENFRRRWQVDPVSAGSKGKLSGPTLSLSPPFLTYNVSAKAPTAIEPKEPKGPAPAPLRPPKQALSPPSLPSPLSHNVTVPPVTPTKTAVSKNPSNLRHAKGAPKKPAFNALVVEKGRDASGSGSGSGSNESERRLGSRLVVAKAAAAAAAAGGVGGVGELPVTGGSGGSTGSLSGVAVYDLEDNDAKSEINMDGRGGEDDADIDLRGWDIELIPGATPRPFGSQDLEVDGDGIGGGDGDGAEDGEDGYGTYERHDSTSRHMEGHQGSLSRLQSRLMRDPFTVGKMNQSYEVM